jgi:two-component system CheB/CheR fusion protein
LADDGHLFLGTAETVGREEDLFAVVSRKWRIYRRIGPTRYDRVKLPHTSTSVPRTSARPSPQRPDVGRLAAIAMQALVERFVPASVLIDRKGEILYFAGPRQDYLRQPSGVPTLDLMTRLRAGLEAGIRGAVRKALRDGGRMVVRGARVRRGDAWHRVEVTAEPLGGAPGLQGLLLVSFADEPPATEPAAARPGSVPEHDEPILRQLEDELETVREDLQGSLQDLQGANQELRVANEEVMSVNEEMRASNEELETSKEELQSLNEELTTVNDTLNDRVVELQQAHNDLDNLLTSSNIATVILDTTFHVRRFTPAATRLFDLTAADVGRPIGSVRARANDSALLHDAAAVLANLRPISAEVQGDDGWWFVRQVQPYRTRDNRIEGVVITFRRRGRGAAGSAALCRAPGHRREPSSCWMRTRGAVGEPVLLPDACTSRPRRPSAGLHELNRQLDAEAARCQRGAAR